ncbi:MAG: DNA-3-methyladenine glycosylase I [Acidobacteriota bacterium]|jgi:DNA-3-methyladenine glycosylase I
MARLAEGLKRGDDGVVRCFWSGSDPLYIHYHDREWGFPVADDQRLFEKICLEGFQSGLSWLTILRKRDNFRRAFRSFDFRSVARFRTGDVSRLLKDAGIVRHRGKVESTINNARRAKELEKEEGSLAAFFWRFEPEASARPRRMTLPILKQMAKTTESTVMSKELKRRGWTYVGPTNAYAFMQAMGLVNDHLEGCAFRERAERARARFRRPRRRG